MGAYGGSVPTLPIKMEVILGLEESETHRVMSQVVAQVVTTDFRPYNRGGLRVLAIHLKLVDSFVRRNNKKL